MSALRTCQEGPVSNGVCASTDGILPHDSPDTESFQTNFGSDRRDIQEAFLLPLSAHTGQSLEKKVSDLCSMGLAPYDLEKVAFTLLRGRLNFPIRGFLTVHKSAIEHDLSSLSLGAQTLDSVFGSESS